MTAETKYVPWHEKAAREYVMIETEIGRLNSLLGRLMFEAIGPDPRRSGVRNEAMVRQLLKMIPSVAQRLQNYCEAANSVRQSLPAGERFPRWAIKFLRTTIAKCRNIKVGCANIERNLVNNNFEVMERILPSMYTDASEMYKMLKVGGAPSNIQAVRAVIESEV